MLTLPPSVKIYLARGVTDMRKSYDGLCHAVRSVLDADPFSGHIFGFSNRAVCARQRAHRLPSVSRSSPVGRLTPLVDGLLARAQA